jgi:hypothetical protein
MCVYIQEHFELLLTFRHLFLEVSSDQLYFCQPELIAFRVVIREEKTVHVLSLRIAPVVAVNDTVRVNYWSYPELVAVTHLFTQCFS